jgi:hypothetical protein
MAKMKRRRSLKSTGRANRAGRTTGKSASKKRPVRAILGKTAKIAKRVQSPTVSAAAKRVLVSAGRTAKALARAGAERAGVAGRKVLARGVRSAAVGVHKGAQGAASALASIADRVEPEISRTAGL